MSQAEIKAFQDEVRELAAFQKVSKTVSGGRSGLGRHHHDLVRRPTQEPL
jgi:hypothetical protein